MWRDESKLRTTPGLPTELHPVRNWLLGMFFLIFAMTIVGGITRLTESGLSIVDWNLIMGTIPPLSDADWVTEFEKYQTSPQYQQVNHSMTVDQFKRIYVWEYVHRLLGRLIGVAFFVPWLFFVMRGRIRGRLAWKTFLAFVLGGLQGVLGWYMVQSGLVDVPAVSHYRLAAHFGLAVLVAMWILWIVLHMGDDTGLIPRDQRPDGGRPLVKSAWAFVILLAVQLIYGAFMAGKDAGHMYATFPDMNGEFFPTGAQSLPTWWDNLLDNPAMIHFMHRTLAYVVAVGAVLLWWRGLKNPISRAAKRLNLLMVFLVVVQIILGAITVMSHVSLHAAVTHQAVGFVMMAVAVALVAALRRPVVDPNFS
ncbi:MAG: COX15/CtaA family protein [Myxococcales bacterium]|nr:COX15/CtaA family protein [Myxococcales bacterium]